jgi:hypothetical protein
MRCDEIKYSIRAIPGGVKVEMGHHVTFLRVKVPIGGQIVSFTCRLSNYSSHPRGGRTGFTVSGLGGSDFQNY